MQETAEHFVHYLADELFQSAFNERLFKLARQESPPFYIAQVLLFLASRLRLAVHKLHNSMLNSEYQLILLKSHV